MTSWKMNIRHETCLVIFFITIMGIFALQCPTNKACHCLLKYDRLAARISCYININSGFYIYIEQHALIQIRCFNSPEWSNLKDFDLNMTPLMSYPKITFDNCNLPSNNSLSDIAYMLGATSIEQLIFSSHNKFNLTLKKHHLSGFKNLTMLHLVDNNLVDMDKDLLADLRNLTGLQLVHNNLHHLPAEFFDYATQLKYLDLRSNKLKLIAPGTFDKLNDLLLLDLSNNHLTELRIENKNLLGLDISNNKNLTLFHGFFSNMVELRLLSMKNNELIALPEDLFWRSIQLKFIDLSHNYLKSLPKHIFRNAINLTILLLNSNNIEELSDYIFENTSFLNVLDLSNNRITSISRKLFNGLYALIELNMEQNLLRTISIESFSSLKSLQIAKFSNNHLTLQSTFFNSNVASISPFHNCSSLEKLYLSHNNISEIILDEFFRTIRILELHSNNISKIRPDVLEFFRNSVTLTYLTLHDNPWECNCDTVDFLHFIHTEYRKITKISQIICHGINKSVSDMIFYDFCPLDTLPVISISVLISLIGFIICILILYYKYQEHIKIWLFAHKWCLRFVTEEQLDQEKLYDAFVSYSHKDHNFVINELVPKLENSLTPYKLCLHYRDCLIDECILDIIARSVQNSKRTIVILSPNFLDNVWGKMEFRIKYCQALGEGGARVIFIFYDDVGLLDDLDSELKAIININMNTCIQWGDPWFWDKLRYALPHQSTRQKSSIVESEVFDNSEL